MDLLLLASLAIGKDSGEIGWEKGGSGKPNVQYKCQSFLRTTTVRYLALGSDTGIGAV